MTASHPPNGRANHLSGERPAGASGRRILLVDCDMFFVQVARLEDPEGAGREKYLIVGGSSTGRGVVTSASYACREYGVRSAMPTARALELCPHAVVVGVNRAAVSRKSRAVREVLEELAPVVQAASVDEFYLDLSGTERLFRGETLEDTAWRIRQEVLERSEISVSIGGGTNRLIAKLATTPAKPAGVHIVPPGAEADFVGGLRLGALPGVGPALLKTLEEKGLRTVADVRRVELEWLERWLGEHRAHWLRRRVYGEDTSEVDDGDPRKSISAERTFSSDIDDDEDLARRLLKLTVGVTATLRKQELQARTVTVKLRDGDFTTRQRSHTFPEPVESDGIVYPLAREMLGELRSRRRIGARLIGVGLSNLVPAGEGGQLAFFEDEVVQETDRSRALNQAVDGLRDRFGLDSVLPAGAVRDEESSRDGRETGPEEAPKRGGAGGSAPGRGPGHIRGPRTSPRNGDA